jgi:hypothetical protein
LLLKGNNGITLETGDHSSDGEDGMSNAKIIRSNRLIRDFPEAARAAFRSTKAPKWNNIPNEIRDTDKPFAYWCSSCNLFHKVHYILGHRVSIKTLMVVVFSVDEDGEWDEIGEYDVDNPSHTKALQEYDKYAQAESWRPYFHSVAQEKGDPLEVFGPIMGTKERWLADLKEDGDSIMLMGTKKVGETTYTITGVLPFYVKDFLNPERTDTPNPYLKGMHSMTEVRANKDGRYEVGPVNNDVQTIFFEVERPVIAANANRELAKLARTALAELDDPMNQRPGDRT